MPLFVALHPQAGRPIAQIGRAPQGVFDRRHAFHRQTLVKVGE
jgi:hypothetical protein